MIKWVEWDDEKLKQDGRFKLIFIKRFGQQESEFMEKGVFGRKGIEAFSNMYMPVIVDADRRPDIFLKYGIKLIPSVVITTKDGKIIAGGGTADYDTFIKFMIELGTLINKERDVIENIAAEDMEEDKEEEIKISLKEAENLVSKMVEQVVKSDIRDSLFLLSVLEYLLGKGNKEKANGIVSVLEKNEDKIEGGLFSGASVTNPISFSTMKEAYLILRYARLISNFSKEKSDELIGFLDSKFSSNGLYFSYISEDDEYYKSTKDIRVLRQKPKVNTQIFFSENAKIAEEFALLGRTDKAEEILRKLENSLVEKVDGKIYKVYHSDAKDVSNLVIDIACIISAYSALFKSTGKTEYKQKILDFLSLINHKKGKNLFFEYDKNGFGFLKKRKIDVPANIALLRGLNRMGLASDEMKFSLFPFVQKNLIYFVEWLIALESQ